jgi:hypothetical protein
LTEALYIVGVDTEYAYSAPRQLPLLIKWIKQKAWECLEFVLLDKEAPFKGLTHQGALIFYSFRRAICPPEGSNNPLLELGHLLIPSDGCVKRIKNQIRTLLAKFKCPKKVRYMPKMKRSNKACLEFSRDAGGFNAGYQTFCSMFNINVEQSNDPFVNSLNFFKASQGLEDCLLSIIFIERRNPRIYYLDIPERGDKHRLPGVPEFMYSFLCARLAHSLKGFVEGICPKTFKLKDYSLPICEIFVSTDAKNSTDNPDFGIWHQIFDELIGRLDLPSDKVDLWKTFIRKVIGPTDIFSSKAYLDQYRDQFLEKELTPTPKLFLDPKYARMAGFSSTEIEELPESLSAFNFPDKPVVGPGEGVGYEPANPKRIKKLSSRELASARQMPIDSPCLTTTRGIHMCYALAHIGLAFLVNLSYIIPKRIGTPEWLTTGDDAASGHTNQSTIDKMHEIEKDLGYLTNVDKTIQSKRGYILGERIFLRGKNSMVEVEYLKLKKLYPEGAGSYWITLPRELRSYIGKIPEIYIRRSLNLVYSRYRKEYNMLQRAGVPLTGPIGLFPEGFIPGLGEYNFREIEALGRSDKVYSLFDPEPIPQSSTLINLKIDEEPDCDYYPFTPGQPDGDWIKPEVVERRTVRALASSFCVSPLVEAFPTQKPKILHPFDVIRRYLSIKGGGAKIPPKPEKEMVRTSKLTKLARPDLQIIPYNQRVLFKDILEPIAIVDYGNYRGKSKEGVEVIIPKLLTLRDLRGYNTVIIYHDAIMGREYAYRSPSGQTILRWGLKPHQKMSGIKADDHIVQSARRLPVSMVWTRDKGLRRRLKGIKRHVALRPFK